MLTTNGRSLLEEVQPLLKGFQSLEERASILARGGETELSFAVDSIFPEDLLFSALARFRASHPHVQLSLHRAIRLSPETAFDKHMAQVCIVTHASGQYLSQPLMEIEMVAVAHRDHPLHRIKGIVRVSDLNNHLLVAIEETPATQPLASRPVLGETWHMNSIEAAIEAVRSGVCFGWVPKDRIDADLQSGKLQVLRLAAGKERRIPLFLLTPERSSSGPSAEHLSSILLNRAQSKEHENSRF